MSSTLQPPDLAILAVYFVVVTFLGVVVGRKKTNTLSDFFIAGGRWGPFVAFIFVFASAVGGAEAVVVAGGAYRSGLSGVWYWLAGIFGVIVYYLFSTIYKRSRVFNLADFFGMRFGPNIATFYAVYGTLLLLFQVGVFALGGGKSIAGLSGLSVDQSVLVASLVVALYLGAGGLMSSLLTDIFQGVLALTAFCFLLLPFLWEAAGGFEGLRQLPPEVWSLSSAELPLSYVTALIFSGTFGAIASPFLFSLLVVGKDERAATQCAWGHLWKRTITILFAIYGMLFFLYKPGLSDPEQAWGLVMKEILPAGLLGLLIASFFGALMSTVDTMAASSSALVVDHILKVRILPSRSPKFYMRCARTWGFFVVFFSYFIARQFDSIKEFIEFLGPLVLLMSVPLFFGVVWRKANRQGTWAGLASGALLYLLCRFLDTSAGARFQLEALPFLPGVWADHSFAFRTFIPSIGCALTCFLVSRATQEESRTLLNRFYCVMNTPIGQEAKLSAVGIHLPAMGEERVQGPEDLNEEALEELYQSYAAYKVRGSTSSLEIVREPGLDWYYRGFIWVSACCFLLVLLLWLGARLMAHLSLASQ